MTDISSPSMPTKSPKLRWGLVSTAAIIVLIVGGIWVYNETVFQKPLQRVLTADPRNRVVEATAHLDGWIDTHTLVFDLTNVSGESSNMDVFRVLVQYAQAMQSHRVDKVILAAFGEKKFALAGDYFQQLGREYATQNPVYTVRTLPHHVVAMDGTLPFPEVAGGWLYVLPKELQDFKTFNERWYVDDFIARHKNG
jgi:hypothetical protein